MGIKHASFIARTVLVRNQNVDEALSKVNHICQREGLFDIYRRNRRYEKPTMVRSRINFEKCKALYNEDMARKIMFFGRRNRKDPFPAL